MLLVFIILLFVSFALPSSLPSTPSPTPLLLHPIQFNAPNSTSPLCFPPLLTCPPQLCYNPNTHKCCPGAHNLCLADQVCGQAEASNGSLAFGCCPGGSSVCGDRCFDASVHECCVGRVGKYGLYPRGSDCCEGMCCAVGEVCVTGADGMMCWPKGAGNKTIGGETSGSIGSKPSRIELGAGVSETKTSGGERRVPPKIVFILLLLLLNFAVSSFTSNTVVIDRPLRSAIPSITQTLPSRVRLSRRWSCHSPKQTCGLGCFVPTDSTCCGAGMCPTTLVCCGQYCCPTDTVCKQELGLNWCVSQPTTASAPDPYDSPHHGKEKKSGGAVTDVALANGTETSTEGAENRNVDVQDAVGGQKKGGGGRGGGGSGGRNRGGGGAAAIGSQSGSSALEVGYLKGALCVTSLVVLYSLLIGF